MYIQCCGANREVTGSCHLLQTTHHRLLVDCGLFQGGSYTDMKNFDPFPFDPKEITHVLITHAHLDHIGRLPKLIHDGYTGPMYATKGTCSLIPLILEDAFQIMMYNNQKFDTPMFYTQEDVAKVSTLLQDVPYRKEIPLGNGDYVVYKDAGHIFGSAFLEVVVDKTRIAFSGDIGNDNVPILKDTESLGDVDILICESTYGDRIHEKTEERNAIINTIITDAARQGGTIMIPAFSTERTQELLYSLNELSEANKLPSMPFFVDSPLAIDITKVYTSLPEYYDEEALAHLAHGDDFFHFPHLHMTSTKEESKMINTIKPPKLIIAGAGMMNGGRILHHAHRYLSDPQSTLIIVGYQAEGTLGRRLYEGASHVTIFGDRIPVRCKVKAIGALSGHGDQEKLTRWIGSATTKPSQILYVHGETHAATTLSHHVRDVLGIHGYIPEFGEQIPLS